MHSRIGTTALEATAAALVILARRNIPTDIQELLVNGDPMRGIPPGALSYAITAYLSALPTDHAELVRRLRYELHCLTEGDRQWTVVHEAATAIEVLSAEIERLKGGA